MKVKPMGMLLMMLAGWINRHQQGVTGRVRQASGNFKEHMEHYYAGSPGHQ